MKMFIQIGAFVLALLLLVLLFRLVIRFLVQRFLLPPLVWWTLGIKLYPQWSVAHPLVFYGVLAVLLLIMVAAWVKPVLENKLLERRVRDEISRTHAEGRIIDGIQMQNGVLVTNYRD